MPTNGLDLRYALTTGVAAGAVWLLLSVLLEGRPDWGGAVVFVVVFVAVSVAWEWYRGRRGRS